MLRVFGKRQIVQQKLFRASSTVVSLDSQAVS